MERSTGEAAEPIVTLPSLVDHELLHPVATSWVGSMHAGFSESDVADARSVAALA